MSRFSMAHSRRERWWVGVIGEHAILRHSEGTLSKKCQRLAQRSLERAFLPKVEEG